MKRFVLVTVILVSIAAVSAAAAAELVRKESSHSVKETIDRLEAAVKERGLSVVVRVDHAAAAKKANLELRPTELIIFGSAAVGTPLIQAEQTMGLSLPIKALAWQDPQGKVWLGYDTPASVAADRGVPRDHSVIGKMDATLKTLAEAATKK